MHRFFFTFGLGLSCLICPGADAREAPLEAAKLVFEDSVSSLKRVYEEDLEALRQRYVRELDARIRKVRDEGDLDQVLLFQQEKDTIQKGGKIEPLPETAGNALLQVRTAYLRAAKRLRLNLQAKVRRLGITYGKHLQALEKNLVRGDRVEEAMAVRREIERLVDVLPPARPPASSAASLETRLPEGRVRMVWHPRNDPEKVMWETSEKKISLPLKLGETHRQSLRGLESAGNSVTRFDGEVAKAFQEAVVKSNAFTLAVGLETDSLDQKGPARILGFSKGVSERNFTLGQEGGKLVLRLRTTETDPNGTSAELTLGELVNRKHVTVVLTYDAGQGIRFYWNGREKKIRRLGGSLETWEPYELVIANETTGDRPWTGTVTFFELHNTALPPEQAQALSRKR